MLLRALCGQGRAGGRRGKEHKWPHGQRKAARAGAASVLCSHSLLSARLLHGGLCCNPQKCGRGVTQGRENAPARGAVLGDQPLSSLLLGVTARSPEPLLALAAPSPFHILLVQPLLMQVPKCRDGKMSFLPLLALPAHGKGDSPENCLSLSLNFIFVLLYLFLLTLALFL